MVTVWWCHVRKSHFNARFEWFVC